MSDQNQSSEEAPIVNLCTALVQQAINDQVIGVAFRSVSSLKVLYLKPGQATMDESMTIPVNLHDPILKRYKMMAGLDPDLTTHSQGGAFDIEHQGKKYVVTVTTQPNDAGERLDLAIALAT